MSDKEKSQLFDPFLLNNIYKEPELAFLHAPKPLSAIKDECLVFLDTNVLLLPYNTGRESLESIKKIYTKLVDEKRIYIPHRVMQEFEKNVPNKLKEIFQKISRAHNQPLPSIQLPLLEEIAEYKESLLLESEVQKSLTEYKKKLKATLNIIKEWHHDDPVRKIYRDVFSSKQLASIKEPNAKSLQADWSYRLANDVPPGFQDKAKEDTGIGDYLVWRAILDTSAELQKDAIFVTGDSKNDWWHVSEGQTLYVRRELVEEYRRESNGHTIRLLTATQFFELFGASTEAVAEIKTEEQNAHSYAPVHATPLVLQSIASSINDWIWSEIGDGTLVTENHGTFLLIKPLEHSSKMYFAHAFDPINAMGLFMTMTEAHSNAALHDPLVKSTVIIIVRNLLQISEAIRATSIFPFNSQFRVVIGHIDGSGEFRPSHWIPA